MKARKFFKRLFLFIGILIFLLVAALFAIPYFFKDQLIDAVEQELDKNLRAKTTFGDIDLSLFRDFPDIAVNVKDLNMVGIDDFEGVPLISADEIDIGLDIMSVIKENQPYQINSIRLIKPRANVLVLENGEPNYDVTGDFSNEQNTTENDAPTVFTLALDKYEVIDAQIDYHDQESDIHIVFKGLNHSGSGNFTQDVYDLSSSTDLERIYVEAVDVIYLNNPHIKLDATINVDMLKNRFTIKENDLRINDLQLLLEGYVAMSGEEWDAIRVNLDFNAPDNSFKQLLSLIPGAYTEDFANVQADGSFSLSGEVDGVYHSDDGRLPPFKLDLAVNDGRFQYPDLPAAVKDIQVQGSIVSESSDLDDMLIEFPRFDMQIGQYPLQSAFSLRRPISDPDIKARVKGELDLADVSQAFPMEGVTELKGYTKADIEVATRLSTVEREAYDQIKMSGNVEVTNLLYRQEGLPTVSIVAAKADMEPRTIYLRNFEGQLGNSDIRASGRINNVLNYFSEKGKISGDLTLASNYFDVNEWIEEPAEDAAAVSYGSTSSGLPAAETEEPFNRFDIVFDADVKKMDYDIYEITDLTAKGHLSPAVIGIDNSKMMIGESDFRVNGKLTNWWDYVYNDATLGGELNVRSAYVDAYALSGGTEAEAAAGTQTGEAIPLDPAEIPDRIAMSINTDIDKLTYDNIVLRELKGRLDIVDKAANVEGMRAKGLGGDLELKGGYDTKDPAKPRFNLTYDLKNLDFQESFKTFNTFQRLAPIAEYTTGSFSSTMVMSGVLGKDYAPVYESINASGFLQTLDAVIKNLKPVSAIGDKLGVKAFSREGLNVSNTKNWFEIKDGEVVFAPADFDVKDIGLNIGGSHSLAGDGMSYNINAKVPRERIDKNALGAAATSGMDWASDQAAKLGVDLGKAEFFNFQIGLSGSLTSPAVKVKLLGTEGNKGVKDVVKDKVDNTVDDAKKRLEEERKKAEAEAKRKLDDAKQQAEAEAKRKLDEAKRKAEEEARKKADEAKKKLEEEAKDKLKKWNPFKKDK